MQQELHLRDMEILRLSWVLLKRDKHVKSNFQAQLHHNHRYLSCNLEKHKFKSQRHNTAIDKYS